MYAFREYQHHRPMCNWAPCNFRPICRNMGNAVSFGWNSNQIKCLLLSNTHRSFEKHNYKSLLTMLPAFACIRCKLIYDCITLRCMYRSKQDNEDKRHSVVTCSILNKNIKIKLIAVINETTILFYLLLIVRATLSATCVTLIYIMFTVHISCVSTLSV